MIRSATPADLANIAGLIRALAEYERLSHAVIFKDADLEKNLFGPRPSAEVLVAEEAGTVVGFALFFTTFSTFWGKPGLWLEDLFVKPEHRGNGHGKKLLSSLARLAVERDYCKLEWAVLNWNEPAIKFYQSLGAGPMDDWTVYRLAGDKLAAVAKS